MSETDTCTPACAPVWDWLCVLRLEQYHGAFRDAGLATYQECQRSLTAEQLEAMGVGLPGHRRRILASLQKTTASSRRGAAPSQPPYHPDHPDHPDLPPADPPDAADPQNDAPHIQRTERQSWRREPVRGALMRRERTVPRSPGGGRERPVPKERNKEREEEEEEEAVEERGGAEGEKRPMPKDRLVPMPPGPVPRDTLVTGEGERPMPPGPVPKDTLVTGDGERPMPPRPVPRDTLVPGDGERPMPPRPVPRDTLVPGEGERPMPPRPVPRDTLVPGEGERPMPPRPVPRDTLVPGEGERPMPRGGGEGERPMPRDRVVSGEVERPMPSGPIPKDRLVPRDRVVPGEGKRPMPDRLVPVPRDRVVPGEGERLMPPRPMPKERLVPMPRDPIVPGEGKRPMPPRPVPGDTLVPGERPMPRDTLVPGEGERPMPPGAMPRDTLVTGEGERPMPDRLVPRLKEVGGEEGGETTRQTSMPTPRERRSAPRGGEAEEGGADRGGGGVDQGARPVPRSRAKYVSGSPTTGAMSPPIPSVSECPPIPPRSSPNCPPQRFTPAAPPPSSAVPPAIASSVPGTGTGTATQTPVRPRRTPNSTIPSPSPTHAPLSLPGFPSTASPSSSPQRRPNTLAIFPPSSAQQGAGEGRFSPSAISPTASLSSSSSSSSSTEPGDAPPLPPKVGAGPRGGAPAPPIPRRPPRDPARRTTAPDAHSEETPRPISEVQSERSRPPPARVPPRGGPENHRASGGGGGGGGVGGPCETHPALPARRLPPQLPPPDHHHRSDSLDDDSSDDFEDSEEVFSSLRAMNNNIPQDTEALQPRPAQTAGGRYNSLCSDDELLDDDDHTDGWEEDYRSITAPQGSFYLPNTGRLAPATKEDTCQCSVMKMGWLDKNPPQGALYYQRRWVKLDCDYLRYFDDEKEVYSKRLISTAFITYVSPVGELKFEVVTKNRTFLFKAENEAERNDWVSTLQDSTRGGRRGSTLTPGSSAPTPSPEYRGFLDLRGLRHKLYTVVLGDKVFLYKNLEDYQLGVGITSIDMNVGNIKDTDRRCFDLTTPYRIFSFMAESEQLKREWVEAMRDSIGEALSSGEVAERIWAEPSNGACADCAAAKPEWAAINLCVVVCKRCAGEHRGLGPSISKVRSLKMDRKVWTEELIKVFLLLGNERCNSFWAANVPPSEALAPSSCSEDRRRFISNKYRQGKYRRYHPLYGNQRELNNALCINVQCSDVLETLSLVFCGADVNCSTDVADCPSPLALAHAHCQPLQAEFLSLNLNTELPRSEVGGLMEAFPYKATPSVCHNGFLFKTGSMIRAVTERKGQEEFSRRWCTLNDGCFSYYESDKNSTPNGSLKAAEILCLSVNAPKKHGYDYTFELYSDSERLYLFGTDEEQSHREWVKSIAKTFIPADAEPLLRLGFERIGRLKYKDGLNLQTPKVGWFALVDSTLHAYLDDSQGEEIHLRKLQELSIQQDNGVLVLVEKGRTLYIEGEKKLDFLGWCGAIQTAAGSGGDSLSQQQLTNTDIPVIVHSCITYITQFGLMSEGIYRKSGVNSRVEAMYEAFRRDARSVHLKEGVDQPDDVSNTLKRFFRKSEEGLLTLQAASAWLATPDVKEDSVKIQKYQDLLSRLPRVNKATLRALVNHLYCVQRFAELNQMSPHNLAIVFGPTLFQTDGKDYTAVRVVEDLIQNYTHIFQVDEERLKTELAEITAIINMRKNPNTSKQTVHGGSGPLICTVYLEDTDPRAKSEQHVKIPGAMTAAELTGEILDRRKITVKDKDYWSCWEVNEKEEAERPLSHQEKVLPFLYSPDSDSPKNTLLIKRHPAMETITVYLASKASKTEVTKHGTLRFREERSILGLGSFNERYFMLGGATLRMYKEIRSNRPDREWPVKNLKVYLGIKKKLRPPTCWGLTVVYESDKQEKPDRQQWYLCCDTHSERLEWFATFLSIQCNGDVWPADGAVVQKTRVSPSLPLNNLHHGNVSLIPLRGSENEMRNSVAAFSQDPLALFRDVR